MNILVIGNGFDLAHGLPTKYTDFLHFAQVYEECYKTEIINSQEIVIDSEIKQCIVDLFRLKDNDSDLFKDAQNQPRREKVEVLIRELHNLIEDNFWIEYFQQCDMHGDENWIDFESEISEVIKSFDKDIHNSNNKLYDEIVIRFTNDFLDTYHKFEDCQTYKKIRDILEDDLNALIRALEIYLTEFARKIHCKFTSPDIREAIEKSGKCMIGGTEVYICNVICFNYTDTYERLYLKCSNAKNLIDYIHGKANVNNTIESNNMVLGIDEYLSDDRKNKDIDFIAFKKYYQRIHKQTGCKYKDWVTEITKDADYDKLNALKYNLEYEENVKKGLDGFAHTAKQNLMKLKEQSIKHNLYIFGHSLDVTDKDILRDLILNDNVYTTIFYHNKDTMGQQIANLVKVIGQDELIRRTGGSTKTIEFKLQQPMMSMVADN